MSKLKSFFAIMGMSTAMAAPAHSQMVLPGSPEQAAARHMEIYQRLKSIEAQPPELQRVEITAKRASPLIAACEEGALRSLPLEDDSLARQFGLKACLGNGVDFGQVFPDERTRLNKLGQLITVAQTLAQRRELGLVLESGEVIPGFWVMREPGGSYKFEWTTNRPASTVSSDNALPGDVLNGETVTSSLGGIIRPAALLPAPVKAATLR